ERAQVTIDVELLADAADPGFLAAGCFEGAHIDSGDPGDGDTFRHLDDDLAGGQVDVQLDRLSVPVRLGQVELVAAHVGGEGRGRVARVLWRVLVQYLSLSVDHVDGRAAEGRVMEAPREDDPRGQAHDGGHEPPLADADRSEGKVVSGPGVDHRGDVVVHRQ